MGDRVLAVATIVRSGAGLRKSSICRPWQCMPTAARPAFAQTNPDFLAHGRHRSLLLRRNRALLRGPPKSTVKRGDTVRSFAPRGQSGLACGLPLHPPLAAAKLCPLQPRSVTSVTPPPRALASIGTLSRPPPRSHRGRLQPARTPIRPFSPPPAIWHSVPGDLRQLHLASHRRLALADSTAVVTKRGLYQPVFQRVKTDHRQPSAGAEQLGKPVERQLQRLELPVGGNPRA